MLYNRGLYPDPGAGKTAEVQNTGVAQPQRDRMHLFVGAMVFGALGWLCGCAAPGTGFGARMLYIDPGFSPDRIAGAPIAVLPLITRGGIDTTGVLHPRDLHRYLRTHRRDLHFVVPYSDTSVNPSAAFYSALFEGDVVYIQQLDSLSDVIEPPFFLSLALKGGAALHQAERGTTRRAFLEGELWDREAGVVLVRVQGRAVSVGGSLPDDEFIREGIRALVREIPPVPIRRLYEASW